MTSLFDPHHIRRAFSRSARSYDAAAALQHEVEARLLESLDYLDDPKLQLPPPQCVLDLGAGTLLFAPPAAADVAEKAPMGERR